MRKSRRPVLLVFLILCSVTVSAWGAERYAFLVAVRQYDKTELTSLQFTENDIDELARRLKAGGYDQRNIVVMTQTLGATQTRFLPLAANIRRELALLMRELQPSDSLLVAFSGHGVQFQGEDTTYFCPADAKLKDRGTLVSLTDVFEQLADPRKCRAGTKVLLVDACRNNPQSSLSKAAGEVELEPVGRALVEPPGGIVAFVSCSKGEKSYEIPELKHGVFFHYVLAGLQGQADLDQDREVSLAELELYAVKNVQKYVRTELGVSQTPERRGQSRGTITLVRLDGNARSTPLPPPPTGRIAGAERDDNILSMKLVWCPPGQFAMGDVAKTVPVTLSQGFWLGKYEVTQGEWARVMSTTPWEDQIYVKEGLRYAASYVSHEDATEFCRKLTASERNAGRLGPGEVFVLPTEAQWEYACRAGTTTTFNFGDDEAKLSDYAWWGGLFGNGNARDEQYAHQVGGKKPNAWGLHDMHGNVWEWCQDMYAEQLPGGRDPLVTSGGSDRVIRGGCWGFVAAICRAAVRCAFQPSFRDSGLGFRVALVPSQ